MKLVGYVAEFFFCEYRRFGGKNRLLQSQRYNFFLVDCFYWRRRLL